MRRGKGQSLISLALFTGTVVVGIVLLAAATTPVLENLADSAAIDSAADMLSDLQSQVERVAEGGEGSEVTTSLSFSRGTLLTDAADDEIAYRVDTEAEIIAPHTSRQVGNLLLSAMASTSVQRAEVDGQDCWRMENNHVSVCLRFVDDPEDMVEGDTVGLWRFNRGSGQVVVDNSTFGNNGTLGSSDASESSDPSRVSGLRGNALDFNGDSATIPQSPSLGSALDGDNLTISFWIKPSPDTSSWDSILSWTAVNGSGDTFTARTEMVSDQDDSIYTRFIAEDNTCGDNTADGGFWARSVDMGITPDEWNFYTVTYNGSAITEYANGVPQQVSFDNCNLADLDSDITLNSLPNGQRMDELRIHNRSLSRGEVAYLYNSSGYLNYVDTRDLLLNYRNKDEGENLSSAFSVKINTALGDDSDEDDFTMNGTGTVQPRLTGSHLGRGRVTADIESFYGIDYQVVFQLFSGSDFVQARVEEN